MLEHIPTQEELRKYNKKELKNLASEIRQFLVNKVSEKGGHLASNLGTVELTLALYRTFHFPEDKVIWDVGHQAYTHKILSGRIQEFDTLRDYDGLSGFPKRGESEYDSFDTGHSTTSISAGLGMVAARDLKHENYKVISVIGDGSMTGGMAFEALNNAAELRSNYIVILNDNSMSISENVGGLNQYLSGIRSAKGYNNVKSGVERTLNRVPLIGKPLARGMVNIKDSVKEIVVPTGMYFENLGIKYLGPVDGHDIGKLQHLLSAAKSMNRCVLIHVITKKGKGYYPAEANPSAFHGVSPFYVQSGLPKKMDSPLCYTDVFGRTLEKEGQVNSDIVGICAAMPSGTGMKYFAKSFPERFFDVGIAEQHAVTFAAGLAAAGMHPVVAIYSTFLQRSYDQILHDVCLQNLPVIFAIDRAGLVGRDGETHQGNYDLVYMGNIPNMTILAPKNVAEFRDMMRYAFSYNHPITLRYPRGSACMKFTEHHAPIVYGKAEVMEREEGIALLALGNMVEVAYEVREKLHALGKKATVVNLRFAKPWDQELVNTLTKDHQIFVTMEDGAISGGMGEKIAAYLENLKTDTKCVNIGIPDEFIAHGDVSVLRQVLHMDPESIVKQIIEEE